MLTESGFAITSHRIEQSCFHETKGRSKDDKDFRLQDYPELFIPAGEILISYSFMTPIDFKLASCKSSESVSSAGNSQEDLHIKVDHTSANFTGKVIANIPQKEDPRDPRMGLRKRDSV